MEHEFEKDHGGRENYYPCKFKKDLIGDCVIRSVAIGTGQDYMVVFKALFALGLKMGRLPNDSKVYVAYLASLGWERNSPLKTASGKKYKIGDFPLPNAIIKTMGHLTCIREGVHRDTYDCRRSSAQTYYTKAD